MRSRASFVAMPVALVIATAAACGDDSTGSGGGGGAAATSSAGSTSATTVSASTADASSSASAGGDGPGSGGQGGAGTGGAGGAGGGGGGSSCTLDDDFPILAEPPGLLSETGLFEEGTLDVDPRVRSFTPAFPLWSDGLDKSRWAYLPPCAIDTADLDHWDFPVGARFYKEFRVGDERVETRVIHRFGPEPGDFWFAAYHWTTPDDAVYVPDGVVDASGTHDIPATTQCMGCHGFLPERILGFGAIQLAQEDAGSGIVLDTLVDEGRLSDPPDFAIEIPAANTVERDAMGYLHANCSHCHNPNGQAFPTPFDLRLSVFDADREETGVFRTAIGVPTEIFTSADAVTHRINPGDPTSSCVNFRMSAPPEQGNDRMPPYATDIVDEGATANMDAWVTDLK